MGVNRIAAYAQNLGIILLEPAVSLPEQGSLAGSTGSEIKHMERQHHHLFAAILAQGNLAMLRRGQLEIRGNIANCCKHNHTPQNSGAPPDAAPRLYPTTPTSVTPKPPHSAIPAFRYTRQSHIPLSPHFAIPNPAFRYPPQPQLPLPPKPPHSLILIPRFTLPPQLRIPSSPTPRIPPSPSCALHYTRNSAFLITIPAFRHTTSLAFPYSHPTLYVIPRNPAFHHPHPPLSPSSQARRPQVHPELVEGWTDWPRPVVLYYPPWQMKRQQPAAGDRGGRLGGGV